MHFRNSETSLARAFYTSLLGILAGDHRYLLGQIRVAKDLGSDLYPLLPDLHFDERALHSDVHRLQTGAFPREQTSGAARELVRQIGSCWIQIYAVGSIRQWHSAVIIHLIETGIVGSHKRPWEKRCEWTSVREANRHGFE